MKIWPFFMGAPSMHQLPGTLAAMHLHIVRTKRVARKATGSRNLFCQSILLVSSTQLQCHFVSAKQTRYHPHIVAMQFLKHRAVSTSRFLCLAYIRIPYIDWACTFNTGLAVL